MPVFPIRVAIDPSGAKVGATAVKNELEGVEKKAESVTGQIKRAFTGLAVALGVREVVALGDEFINLRNKLGTVTEGAAELRTALDYTFDIANRTRVGVSETAQAFQRFSLATKELGLTQQQVAAFTESVNQAIILSGASGAEASAGLIQFSQGLAAGALRGDEFRSVSEQLPMILEVLKKDLGKTRGELKKMADAGLLTADLIYGAFNRAEGELREGFGKTVPTVAQAMTLMRNAFLKAVMVIEENIGLFSTLGGALVLVVQFLNTLATALGNILSIFKSTGDAIDGMSTQTKTLIAIIAGPLIAAIGATVVAAGGLTAAFAALAAVNPLTWVGAAAVGVAAFHDEITDGLSDLWLWGDEVLGLRDKTVKTAGTIAEGRAKRAKETADAKRHALEALALGKELTRADQHWLYVLEQEKKVQTEIGLARARAIQRAWDMVNALKAHRIEIDANTAAMLDLRSGGFNPLIGGLKLLEALIEKNTAARERARESNKQWRDDLRGLIHELDPTVAALDRYDEGMEILTKAKERDRITTEQLDLYQRRLAESTVGALAPMEKQAQAAADWSEQIGALKDRLKSAAETIWNVASAWGSVTQGLEERQRLSAMSLKDQEVELELARALNQLKAEGRHLSAEEVEILREQISITQQVEAANNQARQAEENKMRTMIRLGQEFSNGLVEGIWGGVDALGEFFVSFATNMAKAIMQALLLRAIMAGIGVPTPAGGFGDILGGLFGFANGGQFAVGGMGGTDSQVVAFRATPGEVVTVQTPQQAAVSAAPTGQPGAGGGVQVVLVDDQRAAMASFMSSPEGERTVIAVVNRNRRKLGL